jgi:hypothetical protein
MIAINKTSDQICQKLLADFFAKYPNARLRVQANRTLKMLLACKIPMPGKPGGWAGGIVYALTNQYRQACGIPCILNQEAEEFFFVSMGTIYKRAAMIRKILGM